MRSNCIQILIRNNIINVKISKYYSKHKNFNHLSAAEIDLCLKYFIKISETQGKSFSINELKNYIDISTQFDINSSPLYYWE